MNQQIEHMLLESQKALKFAYAPYSKFAVAACIQTQAGNCYTGVNVENGPYGLTLCAESSAIAKMVGAGERTIQSILIIAGSNTLCAPCGACRQRIHEFSTKDTRVLLCEQEKVIQTFTLSELLPLAFDFK